ncbi:hypothetical protein QJS04_geneDACA013545 [Acorus gramineus]|uniref:Uncharacterized protein n=1 Tax=Acorus gramineus TaxID=55184 RepID=A0AAV9AIN9_ACOGR|nr:hypothetical protein QJS04_geneDACA013545 [Acorus gramineus]
MTCARASAAGFTSDNVSELLHFADRFGAHRLSEACNKFISLSQRRPELISGPPPPQWKRKAGTDGGDRNVRSSSGSDMSIDEEESPVKPTIPAGPHKSPPPDQTNTTFRSHVEIENKKADAAENVRTEEKPTQPDPVSSAAAAAASSRRLSVQDRINLFENKRKEQQQSSAGGGSGGGPAKIVAPVKELRRLSSDISSAAVVEKSVLRRWSGASDMSVDYGSNNSSSSSSSSSSSNLVAQLSSSSGALKSEDAVTSLPHTGSKDSRPRFGLSSDSKEQSGTEELFPVVPSPAIVVGPKDVQPTQALVKAFIPGRVTDQVVSQSQLKKVSAGKSEESDPGSKEPVGTKFKAGITVTKGFVKAEEPRKSDSSSVPKSHWRSFPGTAVEEVVKKEQTVSLSSSSLSSVSSSSHTRSRDIQTKQEDFSGVEDSGPQGMKLQRQTSLPEQVKKPPIGRDESVPVHRNGQSGLMGRKAKESMDIVGTSAALVAPIEKAMAARQSRGNQELNDELQMKADELERLFAVHKLRTPSDQTTSSRRSRTRSDSLPERLPNFTEVANMGSSLSGSTRFAEVANPGSSSSGAEFDVNSLMKIVNQDSDSRLKKVVGSGSLDDLRGKFYARYMEKRNAKLREEWGLKGAQKEAQMKSMHDSLERSRAEMQAKFAGSLDRQDSARQAHQRAEKLRSFTVRSVMKSKEQAVELPQSEEEDELPNYPECSPCGQDSFVVGTLFGDSSSKSIQSRKNFPNRNVSSSTPRSTLVAPLPKSSRTTNSNSGRHRTQLENPLTQSVPNFLDFRKENTKPSAGASKITTRSQVRYVRSKSTIEEIDIVREEKPRRSQSMRKSSVNPGEVRDPSPPNPDTVVLTPLRFSKEQTEPNLYNKIPKSSDSKPFLRKGNGIGPGAGAGLAKLKASMTSESLKFGEESEGLVSQMEDSVDVVKEEEEYERASAEESIRTADFPADSDNDGPRLSHESEKLGDPGSDNGEILRSLSQVDDFITPIPAVPSNFTGSVGNMQDSPGESPASWNSRGQHLFSYAHEASDVDVSVDSPMGSPASWNSHPLNQMMEADAARMRKKWGSAQKPILVNASHQSRKDVTKGFKRLLKFGRKGRGSESLLPDWVSASTASEGDDDTEDGRDPANRSSEDLRKSRMGFLQEHSSYDGFNEGDIFHDTVETFRGSIPTPPANFKLREDHLSGSSLKAPRTFFSLSSFRSKGSESKLR